VVARNESLSARSGISTARALAALVCTVALVASCALTAERLPAQTAADTALANRVYLALNADPVYFFRHVDVSVNGSVASLSGYVWTADAIYRARQIAIRVPGVTRVVTNHLELEREGLGRGPAR
jgi:osmotically-inducible protein OsmY